MSVQELSYCLCLPCCCTVLLQHGADPNIRNTDGKSALDLAEPSAKAVLTGQFLCIVCHTHTHTHTSPYTSVFRPSHSLLRIACLYHHFQPALIPLFCPALQVVSPVFPAVNLSPPSVHKAALLARSHFTCYSVFVSEAVHFTSHFLYFAPLLLSTGQKCVSVYSRSWSYFFLSPLTPLLAEAALTNQLLNNLALSCWILVAIVFLPCIPVSLCQDVKNWGIIKDTPCTPSITLYCGLIEGPGITFASSSSSSSLSHFGSDQMFNVFHLKNWKKRLLHP